jgi:hypothetical protein
MNASVFLDWL